MQWPIPSFPTKVVTGFGNVSVSAANTKGSWVTILTAPTDQAGSWLSLGATVSSGSGDKAALLDLGVGAPGSETIIAADLVWGHRDSQDTLFPLYVPAGANLRARFASPLSFMILELTGHLFVGEPDSGVTTPGRITGYGTIPASSAGTNVTPSGTINVKGSWAQLTASTAAPIHALMVLVQSSSATPSAGRYIIDIGVGASGQETIIVPNHTLRVETTPFVRAVTSPFLPMSLGIPVGTRLAARCAVTSGSITTPIEVAVYGFTY